MSTMNIEYTTYMPIEWYDGVEVHDNSLIQAIRGELNNYIRLYGTADGFTITFRNVTAMLVIDHIERMWWFRRVRTEGIHWGEREGYMPPMPSLQQNDEEPHDDDDNDFNYVDIDIHMDESVEDDHFGDDININIDEILNHAMEFCEDEGEEESVHTGDVSEDDDNADPFGYVADGEDSDDSNESEKNFNDPFYNITHADEHDRWVIWSSEQAAIQEAARNAALQALEEAEIQEQLRDIREMNMEIIAQLNHDEDNAENRWRRRQLFNELVETDSGVENDHPAVSYYSDVDTIIISSDDDDEL